MAGTSFAAMLENCKEASAEDKIKTTRKISLFISNELGLSLQDMPPSLKQKVDAFTKGTGEPTLGSFIFIIFHVAGLVLHCSDPLFVCVAKSSRFLGYSPGQTIPTTWPNFMVMDWYKITLKSRNGTGSEFMNAMVRFICNFGRLFQNSGMEQKQRKLRKERQRILRLPRLGQEGRRHSSRAAHSSC